MSHQQGITIIIPYYRNAQHIRKVVEAVQNALLKAQTTISEILIIDDKSDENLAEILNPLDVKIIKLPKRSGVSRARNAGAKAAQYPYLLFIDSDVIIQPDSIAKCLARMQLEPALSVITGIYDVKTIQPFLLDQFFGSYAVYSWNSADPQREVHLSSVAWSQFLFIKRSVFEYTGGFDVSVVQPCLEDVEFSIRLSTLEQKICLDKTIQNTHLKKNSLKSFTANYFNKTLMWAELKHEWRNFYYTGFESKEKVASLFATWVFIGATMSGFLAINPTPFIWTSILSAALFLIANRRYAKYARQLYGALFTIKALGLIALGNLIITTALFKRLLLDKPRAIWDDIKRFGNLGLIYAFKPAGRLTSLTLFVTNKCNLKCSYCCYSEHLNKKEDILSLDEIRQISKKAGRIENVIVTGGEPFLRRDLVEIIETLYSNNKMRKLSIITNGSFPTKVKTDILEILQLCRKLHVIVNVSNEGGEQLQTAIRGPGSEEKLRETFKELNIVAQTYKRLCVEFIYTFNTQNQDQLREQIQRESRKTPNLFTLNLQRGNSSQHYIPGLNIQSYKQISNDLFEHNKMGYHFFLSDIIRRTKLLSQKIIAETYLHRKFISNCYAGLMNVTLYNTGVLAPCEMLNSNYGNIRDFNYNLKNMLQNKKARLFTRSIIKEKCFCTHECNVITNTLFNPRYLPQLLFDIKKPTTTDRSQPGGLI